MQNCTTPDPGKSGQWISSRFRAIVKHRSNSQIGTRDDLCEPGVIPLLRNLHDTTDDAVLWARAGSGRDRGVLQLPARQRLHERSRDNIGANAPGRIERILEFHPSAVVDSKLECVSVLERIGELRVQRSQHGPYFVTV